MGEQVPARSLVATACERVLASADMPWPVKSGEEGVDWLGEVVESYGEIWGPKSAIGWEKEHGALAALNLWLLQLNAVNHADFLTMSDFRAKHGQPVFWNKADAASPEQGKFIFQTVVGQLCNYNHSMFELAKAGLDLQLLALFRSHIDLSEQAVLLACDREYFDDYITSLDFADDDRASERREHWAKKLSPKVVRWRLKQARENLGLDQETAHHLACDHQSTYSWISAHHHGYPLALMVRSYGEERSKIGGHVDKDTIDLVRKITYFNYEFFAFLEGALGKVQKWTMDPRKEFCMELLFKWLCFRLISLALMDTEEQELGSIPEASN